MHVLAIDTCGGTGTVALTAVSDTGNVTCNEQTELGSRTASAELMPAIERLLHHAGLTLRQLQAILVVNGPGSFTGLRVGLSTAKGLSHASGVPLYAVSRLAVLAHLAARPDALVLLDAGRNEFYAGQSSREWLASFHEIATLARGGARLCVAEPGVAAKFAEWQPALLAPLDACEAVRSSVGRLLAGVPDDLASLDANYLRRSDAELFGHRPAAVTGSA